MVWIKKVFEDLNFYFVEISSEYLNLEGYLVAGGEIYCLFDALTVFSFDEGV